MSKRGPYKKFVKKDTVEAKLPRSTKCGYNSDDEVNEPPSPKRARATHSADLEERQSDLQEIGQLQPLNDTIGDEESNSNHHVSDEANSDFSSSSNKTETASSCNHQFQRSSHEIRVCADLEEDDCASPSDEETAEWASSPRPLMMVDDPILAQLFNDCDYDTTSNLEFEPYGHDIVEQVGAQDDSDLEESNILSTDVYDEDSDGLETPNVVAEEHSPPGVEATVSHKELKKALQSETFTSPIATPVNASPAEAIIMALAVAEVNNLSFKAFVDSVKLLNSLFCSPVLPETQYFLDKLLFCESDVERFFYCQKCTHAFGTVDHQQFSELVCPEEKCGFVNHIKDLTRATYFLRYSIESQMKLLLVKDEVKDNLRSPMELVQQSENGVFKDLYDGSCYKEFVNYLRCLPNDIDDKIISFCLCTDGSPLFKSSSFSIWPILLCINELPPLVRMRNLLLGGLWFGNKHPPMDLFLQPIVHHIMSLSRTGFEVQIGNLDVKMRCYCINCCVDSGARGAVQGINSHSGYFSCNWCEIAGLYVEKRVVFPFEDVPSKLREHQEVERQARQCMADDKLFYVFGVQFMSPLTILPGFNIVNGMVQDFLHNVPFGIGRVFLDAWLNNAKRSFYIGSPNELGIMNKKISNITPCIEVRRSVRPLSVCSYWNAREYENWILFYSIPVLSDVLPPKFLNHWVCFVQAIYLLSRQSVTNSDVNNANKLLISFVANVEEFYGEKYMTFNVHILTHLAQNVSRWGPTWAVSTYCFESAIGGLKRLLHAQRGVPHQIQRAISYKEAKSILLYHCESPKAEGFLESISSKPNKMTCYFPLKECVAIGKSHAFVPNPEEAYLVTSSGYDINLHGCTVYSKIIASRCVYTTDAIAMGKSFHNSVAILTSGEVVVIKKFIVDKESEKTYLFCVNVQTNAFLKFPQNVRIFPSDHCVRKVASVGRRLIMHSVNDLKITCVYTSIGNDTFISPMHNLFNVC